MYKVISTTVKTFYSCITGCGKYNETILSDHQPSKAGVRIIVMKFLGNLPPIFIP